MLLELLLPLRRDSPPPQLDSKGEEDEEDGGDGGDGEGGDKEECPVLNIRGEKMDGKIHAN